ncbi:MAG: hypothetical protein F7C35_07890 [Desulfurococcales archaeon]|nr:hypothetical protein [Desulfurococcales archaeon]
MSSNYKVINKTKIVSIMLIIMFMIYSFSIMNTSAQSDSIRISISGESLKSLGLKSGYVVSFVTLYVPGVTVATADKVLKDKKTGDLIIEFKNINKYQNKLNRLAEKSVILRDKSPTININIIDYNTGLSYNIFISTLTINIIDIAENSKNKNYFEIIKSARQQTLLDPFKLLEKRDIRIGKDDIKILEKYGFINKVNIKYQNKLLAEKLRSIRGIGLMEADCSWDAEYPYNGTGIFQEIDHTKYAELTQEVPGWWYERYVQVDYDDSAEDDYRRLVKDFFASSYYVDKSKYSDINDAIETLMEYIVYHMPGGSPLTSGTIGIVTLEEFVGSDHWKNTKDSSGSWKILDLPLFRYMYVDNVDDQDAQILHVETELDIFDLTGARSGLTMAGVLVTGGNDVSINWTNLVMSADINNEDRRVGTIYITNALITYGQDVILVRWLTDNVSCGGSEYYFLTPVAVITPLYSVDYSGDDIVAKYEPDLSDPLSGFLERSMHKVSYSWLEDKETPPGDNDVLVQFKTASSEMGINVSYSPLLDLPPIMGPLAELTLGELSGGIGFLLSNLYSFLTSIEIIQVNVQAEIAKIEFTFDQESTLSRDILVTVDYYNTTARYVFNGEEFYNLIIIKVEYPNNPPPPCGPSACPTGFS